MSRAHAFARALGGEVAGRDGVTCPGPGHSAGDRSLHVTFTADGGFTCHSFAGDDWRACRDHVQRALNLPDDRPLRPQPAATVQPSHSALGIWAEARPAGRTAVTGYLASRGLSLAGGLETGEVLRFHPSCPFRLDTGGTAMLPAMVALFRDLQTNAPVAIHRTAIKPDGSGKLVMAGLGTPKKMLGPVKGAAIKLSPDDAVSTGLAIAEGIETALACLCDGRAPIWAMGSAGAISTLPPLPGIEALTILADHDETGIAAARACAQAWVNAGREVTIAYPQQAGADWNDRRPQ